MAQELADPNLALRDEHTGRWNARKGKDDDYITAKGRLTKYVRAKSFKAIQKVYRIMEDPKASPAVQLAAAQVIIERAFGKSVQPVETSEQGATLESMLIAIWSEKHKANEIKVIECEPEPSE